MKTITPILIAAGFALLGVLIGLAVGGDGRYSLTAERVTGEDFFDRGNVYRLDKYTGEVCLVAFPEMVCPIESAGVRRVASPRRRAGADRQETGR